MKSFDQLSEDLATRRAELKQRQLDQAKKFKSKGIERVNVAKSKSDALKQMFFRQCLDRRKNG